MDHPSLLLLRDSVRLAFYALIAGPALLLYVTAITFVLDSSPSQQFLDAARRLTDGAPAGKVMQCVAVAPSLHVVIPQPHDDARLPEPVPHLPTPCHMEPVDSDFWTRPTDSLLTSLWLIAALCGAAYAFMTQRYNRHKPITRNAFVLQKKEQLNER